VALLPAMMELADRAAALTVVETAALLLPIVSKGLPTPHSRPSRSCCLKVQ